MPSISDVAEPGLVLELLQKIESSRTFESLPRQKKILRFLVEATLAGRQKVKALAVAYEALDIQDEVIGRVEAGRLRKILPLYYDREGRADPIRIEIAERGYALAFQPVGPNKSGTPPVPPNVRNPSPATQSEGLTCAEGLLAYVWSYPLTGENEGAWAIKESAALRGKLGSARDEPSLGVAIVTTELALASFGEAADSRIDRCIMWAISRAEREPPYRMLVEDRNPADHTLEAVKPDFRHTLAFGVVLARAKRQFGYLHAHLELVLSHQLPDGSWPPENPKTSSPVFTAIYALELLHLGSLDPATPARIRTAIPKARIKGMTWLLQQRGPDGLWPSGVLGEFAWDGLWATAWVLHRLVPTADVVFGRWTACVDDALFRLVQVALSQRTWAGSTEDQRYRVEARVAAAVRRAHIMKTKALSSRSQDAARLYTGAWQARADHWVNQLSPGQMDVGTAAFLVWGLVPVERLAELGRLMLLRETHRQ